MMDIPITQIFAGLGTILVIIGFWGIITRNSLIRIIISFSIVDSGVHLIMVGLGYISGGTAPIFDRDLPVGQTALPVVDPIPSALVLTAIVIGLAVTALMLSYAVRLYHSYGTISVDKIKELKW